MKMAERKLYDFNAWMCEPVRTSSDYEQNEIEKLRVYWLAISMATYFHDLTGYATFINCLPKD